MTDKQRLKFQQLAMLGARDSGDHGISAAQLQKDARTELGLELTEERVLSELRFLADSQQFVESITVALVGVRWIITERGLNALAKAGL